MFGIVSLMNFRVDNIPWHLKIPFWIYGYGCGFLMYLASWLIRLMCRVVYQGREHLPPSNFILCTWHDNIFPYLTAFHHHPVAHIWMNHPAWFMKPVHVILALIGIRDLVLGSTGHDGKLAADRLVDYLKQGYATMAFPDGPAGPRRVLKKGVLHMALQSGVPIIPLKIRTSRCLTLPTWDRKRIPLFATLTVIYEKPIQVTHENFEAATEELTRALS